MNKSTKTKRTNALRKFQPKNKNLKMWSTRFSTSNDKGETSFVIAIKLEN